MQQMEVRIPWNWITTGLAILGIAFAVYTHFSTERFRKLTYYVNPARTVVIKSGETTSLRVLHRGQDIKGDVTAAQIWVWNEGNEPIRKEDILDEIRIVTSPQAPILEASVRRVTRDVLHFGLDDSRRAYGIIPLSWKILERNDGGVVQLIYAGPTTVEISVVGTIVGQSHISAIRFTGKITSPSEQIAQSSEEPRQTLSFLLTVIELVLVVMVVFDIVSTVRRSEPIPWNRVRSRVLWMILWLTVWFLGVRFLSAPSPPFGI
jgi:hypothetical protein